MEHPHLHGPFSSTVHLLRSWKQLSEGSSVAQRGPGELADIQAKLHRDMMAVCEHWVKHCPQGLELDAGIKAVPMEPQAALIQDGRRFKHEPRAWQVRCCLSSICCDHVFPVPLLQLRQQEREECSPLHYWADTIMLQPFVAHGLNAAIHEKHSSTGFWPARCMIEG